MKLFILAVLLVCSSLSGSLNALEKGELSPVLMLSNFEDNVPVNLSDYRGKLVYIDFWASWCRPCKKSFPFMNELHQNYAQQGLEILAINMDENSADAEKFLEKYPAKFSIMKGTPEVARTFGVPGLPVGYLIDKNGVVVAKHTGFNAEKAKKLIAQINFLMAQ